MNFIDARDLIEEVLISDRSEKRKRFITQQLVMKVANTEGVEPANALIRHFDLFMFDRGSISWFEGEGSNYTRPIVAQEDIVLPGDKRIPTKRDNKELKV